ncbi:MOSC domain-containing protein [Deinococcus detaillensis]|uniref:MOSC domain-containing protein n=1 Tax=Deinococcus detaillensis TaxID=2592048 RepID=A0A553UWR4_9DEIO|nr:MOSC domain-containing protein [Deinococcus detaillensis]TSA84648.1 MOSC domain-containing protein [Deinococcus detaillensis]
MNSRHSEGHNRDAPVGQVGAVSRSGAHEFSKPPQPSVRLLAGLGVEGDAHSGVTVQHRSRVAADPSQPNLRQVHLLHAELFEELAAQGFEVSAGQLGENVTTLGLDLLALPAGTRLHLGGEAVVEITGLRNPCAQIERFGAAQRSGLLAAVLGRDDSGHLIRKAGIMGVVLSGGEVKAGDDIEVEWPPPPWTKLDWV